MAEMFISDEGSTILSVSVTGTISCEKPTVSRLLAPWNKSRCSDIKQMYVEIFLYYAYFKILQYICTNNF